MKNFTNNFKQFTSRLSARWLIMALMLLVGTSSVWAVGHTKNLNIGYNDGSGDHWTTNINDGGTIALGNLESAPKLIGINAYTTKWQGGNICSGSVSVEGATYDATSINWKYNNSDNDQEFWFSINRTLSSTDGEHSITVTVTIKGGTTSSSCASSYKRTFKITYNIVAPETYSATIKFKRPAGWSNTPNIHIFNNGCTGSPFVDNKAMTSLGTANDGSVWYKYDYTVTTTCENATIMFNNGGWGNGQTNEQFKGDLGTDYCLTGGSSTDVTSVDCPVFCTTVNVPNVTSNGPICAGSTATLTLNNRQEGVTYKLNSTTGTPIFTSDENDYTTSVLNDNTTYTIYASLASGACENDIEGSVTVTVNAEPNIILTQKTETICKGNSITLANYIQSNTGTVTWYTDQAMTQTAAATVSPTTNTTYYAKAVNSPCAAATAQLAVTVNDKPAVPTLSADNTSLVAPNKATLTVGNTVSGLTYTLYNGENAVESQTSTGSDLTFEAGEAGSYTVEVTNDCGTSISTPAIVVTVCTPQINTFVHTNSSYVELQNQNPTYYVGDKVYFKSTLECCLTGTWKKNEDELWWTGMKADTPFKFYIIVTKPGDHIISNLATDGCKDVADADVDVKLNVNTYALSQVTNANGTASGADIALTWNHSANHSNVMVVRYPSSGTETIPAGGQAYTDGNTLGGGTVVYVGTEESYTDQNLPAGVSYKYYFYTVNNNYYSEGVVLSMSSCPTPAKPSLSSTAITACNGECTAQGYITINNMNDYKDDTYTFELGSSVVTPDANGRLGINSTADTQYTVTVTNSCGNPNSATVDIAINDNKPTITGNNSFQPGGSTTLTSDKGASTTWVALDGGNITSSTTGTSIEFTANENGTYHVQATYNGCSTTVEIKVQDDLYVWVRRPIKKEKAYTEFFHEDQNSTSAIGGDLFYKEFASLPGDYTQYNQGGKAADKTCTDKDGYTWYGFVVSKTAIENEYYFTVHAPNDGGTKGTSAKYNGYHTHTYATQLVNMDSDLYFVMDEVASNNNRGWNINTPVVVRASGDASFNGNNFADFVPLYVKDANICGKEVVSFEWQKSDSQNGTYTTYNGKSGAGINNIRTREAGWYRCVVTYGDGKGTATSNAIQVTNAGGTSYTFTSKLPILMVNTNDVGFPKEPASGFPSVDADNLKAKVSVDVIIKKGDDIVYDRKARMNYRGSSSLNFKKKSYAFVSGQDSCVFDKSRHDYVKTKKAKMLNILGLDYATNDKDWVLYAATPDPSMMRNRLVFDLYQQMRPGEWGVHSTYVELIVDGEYQGVYVFMDKITANEGRVNITNSDGFIVKFDKTDVADRVEKSGDQKTFATTRTGTKNTSEGITSYDTKIDQRFEIEYPEKEDIEDAGGNWEAFYKGVQQRFEDFETALANKQYDKVRAIIDYDSWADWFILSEFIKNQDGFRASNIFIYNGGKIIATPLWDQELSMDNRTRMAHGSSSEDGLLSTTSSVYSDAFPAPFWFTNKGTDVNNLTGGLLNDPCFVALVKSKWDDYQSRVLSASNCSTLVAKYHGELDDNIRSREATKWPYTQAARGTTNNGKYMGYYNDTEGDPTHYSYNASKNAITSYATKRSTELKDNVGGLGEAIYDLNGETLIFNIKPSVVETSPWQQSIVTVNAPEGYEYTLDYSALTAVGAEVKENGNAYTIKMPRPSGWEISGNGTAKKETYTITATIDAEGENSCGAQIENTATATINVNDVTEDCDPPIVKP